MSSILAGQLWVSAGHAVSTYYVVEVKGDEVTLVQVRIDGTGKDAKVQRVGQKYEKASVTEMLEAWLPVGRPLAEPPTWHTKLLEDPGF